jgi:hypothetical protein
MVHGVPLEDGVLREIKSDPTDAKITSKGFSTGVVIIKSLRCVSIVQCRNCIDRRDPGSCQEKEKGR